MRVGLVEDPLELVRAGLEGDRDVGEDLGVVRLAVDEQAANVGAMDVEVEVTAARVAVQAIGEVDPASSPKLG